MSDTPRVDAQVKTFTINVDGIPTTLDGKWVDADFARGMETEIAILEEELKQYKQDNGIFGAGA
ncbi:MAG TPA: hypothetical protein VK663_01860 [Burkholderiales bacterium]|nr:hypothetical protein [Burkholderiales bacterium]